MAIERKDEVLDKAVATDTEIIPRYKLVKEDGTVVAEHVELQLENPVLQQGMPYDRDFANEVLAASGTTSGALPNLTLEQPGFVLEDGAMARATLHAAIAEGQSPLTLNVGGTGAFPLRTADLSPSLPALGAGASIEAVYHAGLAQWVLTGVQWRAGAVPWGGVAGKPSAFAPSAHNQAAGTITAGTFAGQVKAPAGTDYATGRMRNIFFNNGAVWPSGAANGDILLVYE